MLRLTTLSPGPLPGPRWTPSSSPNQSVRPSVRQSVRASAPPTHTHTHTHISFDFGRSVRGERPGSPDLSILTGRQTHAKCPRLLFLFCFQSCADLSLPMSCFVATPTSGCYVKYKACKNTLKTICDLSSTGLSIVLTVQASNDQIPNR